MGGLAQLAQAAGHVVSGCDANVYPPMSDQLAAANVRVIDGYDADQLRSSPMCGSSATLSRAKTR